MRTVLKLDTNGREHIPPRNFTVKRDADSAGDAGGISRDTLPDLRLRLLVYFQKGYSIATLRHAKEFEDSNIKEVLAIARGLIAAGFLRRVRGRGPGTIYLISQDGMKIFDVLKQA